MCLCDCVGVPRGISSSESWGSRLGGIFKQGAETLETLHRQRFSSEYKNIEGRIEKFFTP